MRSSWDRIGHATVVAATPAEAERIAAAAMAKVSVKVRPDVG
jgi:hypothetical protein